MTRVLAARRRRQVGPHGRLPHPRLRRVPAKDAPKHLQRHDEGGDPADGSPEPHGCRYPAGERRPVQQGRPVQRREERAGGDAGGAVAGASGRGGGVGRLVDRNPPDGGQRVRGGLPVITQQFFLQAIRVHT